jgi:putative flippase GtrA
MEQFSVRRGSDEIREPSNELNELEMQVLPVHRQPSYTPTRWIIVNRMLDIVDEVTKGHADWVQRFFSYGFIGGIAALVNLTIFSIVDRYVPMPVSEMLHNLIAQVIAFEISLMTNFIPNDYFTFRHLAGHSRSWAARCLRYHITSITGFSLTVLIEFIFTFAVHIPPFFSQAIALILVFIYNFTFHHLFTYRRVSHTPKQFATRVDIHQHGVTEESAIDEGASRRATSGHVSANSATPL